METLKSKCLHFLYKWTNDGKLGHLRKGMVEELEEFISSLRTEEQIQKVAAKMVDQLENADAKDTEQSGN